MLFMGFCFGLVWFFGSQCEGAGKARQWEPEVAEHIASIARKQRETESGARFSPFYLVWDPGTHNSVFNIKGVFSHLS